MHFQEGSRKKLILSSRGKGLHNGACVKLNYKCLGKLPRYAKWASDNEQENLISNIPISPVSKNTPKKCEYMCNKGYTFKNGVCKRKYRVEPLSCGGPRPDNTFDASTEHTDIFCNYDIESGSYDCPVSSLWGPVNDIDTFPKKDSNGRFLVGCICEKSDRHLINYGQLCNDNTAYENQCRFYCFDKTEEPLNAIPICSSHKKGQIPPSDCKFKCPEGTTWDSGKKLCVRPVFDKLEIHRRSKCDTSSLYDKDFLWRCEENEKFGVPCPSPYGSYSIACYALMSPQDSWKEGDSCFCNSSNGLGKTRWPLAHQEAGWYQGWWHIEIGKLNKYGDCLDCKRETFNYGLDLGGNRNSHHPGAGASIERYYTITPTSPRIYQETRNGR